jgi:GAF domain-containing protein
VVADAFGPAAAILAGFSVDVGDRLTGWVAASRQPIVNDAALDLEGLAERASPALRSCLGVPLLMGETLVGVLTLYSPQIDCFGENRSRVVQIIAPHLASALRAAGRNEAAAADPGRGERGAQAAGDLRLVRR